MRVGIRAAACPPHHARGVRRHTAGRRHTGRAPHGGIAEGAASVGSRPGRAHTGPHGAIPGGGNTAPRHGQDGTLSQ